MTPDDWAVRRELNEEYDCTVRAVVWASGAGYGRVHEAFKDQGREHRRGIYLHKGNLQAIGRALGLELKIIKRSGSVGKLIEKNPTGRIVVEVRRHAFAVIDGDAKDPFLKLGGHVVRAWAVKCKKM